MTRVDLELLCRGVGVRDVNVVDAFNVEEIERTLRRCVETEEPSVIIARGPCPLRERISGTPFTIDVEKCDGCATCLRLGCPALSREGDKARIDESQCLGERCSVCLQVCPREAIIKTDSDAV